MKRDFFKVKDDRIKLSTIKKYRPSTDGMKLIIYYSVSRTRVEFEQFEFKTKKEVVEILDELDLIFGIS